MRGMLSKYLKYEHNFYSDIICIFWESSSIILSFSLVIIIFVYSTQTHELDFDLVCCRTNEHH